MPGDVIVPGRFKFGKKPKKGQDQNKEAQGMKSVFGVEGGGGGIEQL